MRSFEKRLSELEGVMMPQGKRHYLTLHRGWSEDLVLDHYGRERIGPDDQIFWIMWGHDGDDPWPYPAGYNDQDGRWAEMCAKHGAPHRDHGTRHRYLATGGWSDTAEQSA